LYQNFSVNKVMWVSVLASHYPVDVAIQGQLFTKCSWTTKSRTSIAPTSQGQWEIYAGIRGTARPKVRERGRCSEVMC